MEAKMRNLLALVPVLFLLGCAATPSSQYTQHYDRKYNAVHYVKKDAADSFVGTSAVKQQRAVPRQHP